MAAPPCCSCRSGHGVLRVLDPAAAAAWGFANQPVDEILAWTAATNLASQAVMRRIGMVAEPWRDFDHPRLAPDHPLRAHVTWSLKRPAHLPPRA